MVVKSVYEEVESLSLENLVKPKLLARHTRGEEKEPVIDIFQYLLLINILVEGANEWHTDISQRIRASSGLIGVGFLRLFLD